MNPQILIDIVTQTMPFGKYKGRLLCDIPEDYLVWMQKKRISDWEFGNVLKYLV